MKTRLWKADCYSLISYKTQRTLSRDEILKSIILRICRPDLFFFSSKDLKSIFSLVLEIKIFHTINRSFMYSEVFIGFSFFAVGLVHISEIMLYYTFDWSVDSIYQFFFKCKLNNCGLSKLTLSKIPNFSKLIQVGKAVFANFTKRSSYPNR